MIIFGVLMNIAFTWTAAQSDSPMPEDWMDVSAAPHRFSKRGLTLIRALNLTNSRDGLQTRNHSTHAGLRVCMHAKCEAGVQHRSPVCPTTGARSWRLGERSMACCPLHRQVAVGFGVGAPPILEPILVVGLGGSQGVPTFDPWKKLGEL